MAVTKLLACNCDHEYQNKEFKGKRLHNATGKGKLSGYRCTVCEKTKSA